MKKTTLLIISLITGIINIYADANWKIHPTFDEEISHVIETPKFIYFTSRTIASSAAYTSYYSLFRYEKEGDEIVALSTDNILSSPQVADLIYNPVKGYVAVLYSDYNIDLLHNNGDVTRIPYYAMASLTYSKNVNGLAIDSDNERIYLATDFGYIAINDKKIEIAESRIYGSPLLAFSRIGDNYFLIHDNQLRLTDVRDTRFNIEDYRILHLEGMDGMKLNAIYPLNKNTFVLKYFTGFVDWLKILSFDGDKVSVVADIQEPVCNVEYNSKGLTAATSEKLYQINTDGTYSSLTLPTDFRNLSATTENMTDVWVARIRKGLCSLKLSGNEWKLTRDYRIPNSPAVFVSTSYVQHPSKGLLVLNHGMNQVSYRLTQATPMELSGYKNGLWQNYAPAYLNPEFTDILLMPNGITLDPDNSNYAYITSPHHGLLRLNLNDPNDYILMTRPNDPFANQDWCVAALPLLSSLPSFANLSHPYFDLQGNLWMNYANWDNRADYKPQFFCWTAADRRATSSASNIKLPQLIDVNTPVSISNYNILLPLLKTGNGLLAFTPSTYDEELMLINTNGTPTDTSDDRVYRFSSYTDNDGNTIELRQIRCLYEDPNTGYVWVSHLNGVCYFIPSQIVNNDNYLINRVKVPRNDGTNLADYLLEGITVNWITSDNQGRKWFATSGAGVVCTSSDGREIIMELTTENSLLPDNVVYSAAYNREANSMIFSTGGGLAEYFLPVSQNSSEKTDVKAYPNPVRPDHNGYVTITDIPQGSLVKIVDSGGNLVKELGIMSGFEILWDISNTRFQRVESGVYYIMVSPSDESGSYHQVGKILVIS